MAEQYFHMKKTMPFGITAEFQLDGSLGHLSQASCSQRGQRFHIVEELQLQNFLVSFPGLFHSFFCLIKKCTVVSV